MKQTVKEVMKWRNEINEDNEDKAFRVITKVDKEKVIELKNEKHAVEIVKK